MSIYAAFNNPEIRARKWWYVDASGLRVGRLATQLTSLLSGKYKPTRVPSADCGDYVVLVNADKVLFSGKKWKQKYYYWHTGYIGGLKQRNASKMLEVNPTEIIRKAVKNMFPDNHLRRNFMNRFLIYAGPDHPHADKKLETYWPFPSVKSTYHADFQPKYEGRFILSTHPASDPPFEDPLPENSYVLRTNVIKPKCTKKQYKEAKAKGLLGHGRSKQLEKSPNDFQLLGKPITDLQMKYAREYIQDDENAMYWPIPEGSTPELYEKTKIMLERAKYLTENPLPAPKITSASISFEEATRILGKYPPRPPGIDDRRRKIYAEVKEDIENSKKDCADKKL